jgi:hypothetical protein
MASVCRVSFGIENHRAVETAVTQINSLQEKAGCGIRVSDGLPKEDNKIGNLLCIRNRRKPLLEFVSRIFYEQCVLRRNPGYQRTGQQQQYEQEIFQDRIRRVKESLEAQLLHQHSDWF